MRIFVVILHSVVLFSVFFVRISSANRTRRQIIFKDDTNRPSNADCQTPDRRPGRCIQLTSCRAFTQPVSFYGVRRYFCGFEGDEPRVCCPLYREEDITTVNTTSPWTTSPTERPNSGSTPEAWTKPPFLPQNCGVSRFMLLRVVGPLEAERGGWPWMAVLFVRRSNGALVLDCGGALVTNQHVVTAAHCVVTGRRSVLIDPSRLVVRLGAHNLTIPNEPGAVDVEVESIRRHEQFEPRTYRNDIAVLKLRTPVTFSRTIAPVCLPYDSLVGEDLTYKMVVVIGYGTMAFNGIASDVLMQSGFYVQSQDVCKKAYESELQINEVYLCAGTMDGSKDSCMGDSGGPLVTIGRNNNFYLVGIVSFGTQCGQPNYPGVYTRVTEFLDWLTKNLSD